MVRKSKTKPRRLPLTDAERQARFVEMARDVEADEATGSFDRAFTNLMRGAAVRTLRRRPAAK